MELNFTKEGNKWVAEFEAPSDFNLHIEREQVSYINIMQRGSSNGEYDLAKSFSADKTFDYDFGALVYPKFIKVVSGSEVVSASVNFNEGGGSGSGSNSNVKHFTFYNWRGGDYNGEDETLTTKIAFTFEFEEGMTWEEWINSKYNTLGMSFFLDSDYVEGRVFLMIRNENGDMPLSVITISLDPQNEFGSNAMQTDEIIPNDYFVYSGCPTAF